MFWIPGPESGTCRYSVVPDMLSYNKTKKVAVYGNVQVTYLGGGSQGQDREDREFLES